MLVDKAEIQKTLRVLTAFDNAASPYVAMQLPEGGKPLFYWVGNSIGFIQSKEYSPNDAFNPVAYVSLGHFSDIIRLSQDDKLNITMDSKGIVRLESTNPAFPARFIVHSVRKEDTGMKTHLIGKPRNTVIDPTAFQGLDIKPFHSKIATQCPLLKDGKLMIPMHTGIVFWQTPECLKSIELSPKENFLRLVGGNALEDLVISSHGYWGAVSSNGMVAYMFGHASGNESLYNEYNQSATEIAKFPAAQLVYALNTASALCGGSNRVDIDPKEGVMFKDQMGEHSTIGLGSYDTFRRFGIHGDSAKTIVDAFNQSKETEAVLLKVNHPDEVIRFKRGAFEVNIKVSV